MYLTHAGVLSLPGMLQQLCQQVTYFFLCLIKRLFGVIKLSDIYNCLLTTVKCLSV
jgi:hypothetical protein